MTTTLPRFCGARIGRRSLLQGAMASALPIGVFGALTGCGGGDGSAAEAAKPTLRKPLVVGMNYELVATDPMISSLEALLTDVLPAVDRFNLGALCHRFNGQTSIAKVTGLPAFDAADFAISYWQRHTVNQAVTVLAFLRADGSTAVAVEFDPVKALLVRSDAASQPLAEAGNAAEMADGSWHHVVIQRTGALIQIFIDGALRTEVPLTASLGTFTSLNVGAPPWQGDLDQVQLHNKAFAASQVPHLVYAWQQLRPSIDVDYFGYYPFNRNARNDTGHGRNGVLHDVVPAVDRFGAADAAFSFNGSSSYIEVLESFDETKDDYAIGLWLKSSGQQAMTALAIMPGVRALDLVCNDNAALSVMVDGGKRPALSFGSPGELTDGKWHFVLVQQRGSWFEVYIDHVLRASAQTSITAFGPGSGTRFGRSSDQSGATTANWSGLLDDVQFHNRSFAAAQIESLESMQFRPRDGAGLLSFQGRLWLLGGWNPDDSGSTNSQIWTSIDGRNWSLAATAPWERRHAAGWLVFNDRMWVIGGDKNQGHYQNDVWSSPDGVQWDLVTSSPPWSDRALSQVLAFNGRMWLMGGMPVFESNAEHVAYNDVYSSINGLNWRLETAQAGWSPRGMVMGSVVHRGYMWLIGGGTYDVRTYNNDVWRSSDGVHWELALAHAPWAPRQYQSITVFDGKIWVIAGATRNTPSGTNDVWYSNDGIQWSPLDNTPWLPRHATSVESSDKQLWMIAGSSTQLYNDVWVLTHAA